MKTFELEVVGCYSEYGHIASIIISNPNGEPISERMLIDVLRDYADFLDSKDEDSKN